MSFTNGLRRTEKEEDVIWQPYPDGLLRISDLGFGFDIHLMSRVSFFDDAMARELIKVLRKRVRQRRRKKIIESIARFVQRLFRLHDFS